LPCSVDFSGAIGYPFAAVQSSMEQKYSDFTEPSFRVVDRWYYLNRQHHHLSFAAYLISIEIACMQFTYLAASRQWISSLKG
jgi:hypothetical protein